VLIRWRPQPHAGPRAVGLHPLGSRRLATRYVRWVIFRQRIVAGRCGSGVDIGARQEFYNVIKQICEGDTGVVLVTSDLPEIVHLSHRVYVMHGGQIQAELIGGDITDEAIASHSFGHGRAAH
jgi:ABC-type sugar transport system ATPase subunit